ncbi:hypothetical protein [Microvirga sp. TS319]|uniref:hypothetical protein n=1 Tax=Microvirga sp. TS319 TaxID=3241165 RepID=UPI00351A1490
MNFTLQPVRVGTGSDEEGMLVFDGEQRLLAVLTHLSRQNEVAPGHWFLEVAFGRMGGVDHPIFADLDAAQGWISRHSPPCRT